MLLYIIIYYIMPKTNVDYSKTIIYKIVCNDENIDYLYVGSTTDFTKRKYTHKCSCSNINNKNYNEKKYIQIRQNGGWDNFKMIEIEKYPCNDKREAEAREEELRIKLKANMNMRRCYTTEEQKWAYYNDNKEKVKEYYNDNKYKIIEQQKAYYINDKEKVKEKVKEHYNNNKEKIKDKKKLKCVCPCGSRYNYGDKAKHFKTAKHKNFLEIQNN